MSNAFDSFKIGNNTTNFTLSGGAYGISLTASAWGTATLNRFAPDGSTLIPMATAIAANGYLNLNLPSGNYQLTVSGTTALQGDITSIVTGP